MKIRIFHAFLNHKLILSILSIVLLLGIVSGTWMLVGKMSKAANSDNNSIQRGGNSNFDSVSSQELTFQSDEFTSKKNYPGGTIVFGAVVNEPDRHIEYYLMNADGAILANIGEFTGSPAWSPDGKYIAIGCKNINQICILNIDKAIVYRSFPVEFKNNSADLIINKIDLPDNCEANNNSNQGYNSISWSKDGKRIIITCTNYSQNLGENSVCILNLSNDFHCWDEKLSGNVTSASFSPTVDILAISRNGFIEIVDEEGNLLSSLTKGVNPIWSPDGKRIVYFAYDNNSPRNGIAVINNNGENQQWLYLQPKNGEFNEYLCAICEVNRGNGGISWSPDGNYITFSADYLGDNTISIFRQNVMTKEIIILVGLNGVFSYPQAPICGKNDYEG